MTSAQLIESFWCERLKSSISRSGCASRHRQYAGKKKHPHRDMSRDSVVGCCCRSCDIGAQHARGKCPDVALVAIKPRPSPQVNTERRCIGCGEPIPLRVRSSTGNAELFSLRRRVCGPSCAAAASEYSRRAMEWE